MLEMRVGVSSPSSKAELGEEGRLAVTLQSPAVKPELKAVRNR